jgi:oxygen-independent coproporphyrinogen-3 oxidase
MDSKPLAVYLHVPFCLQKCTYCDFLSFSAPAETMRRYASALEREVELQHPLLESRGLNTVYFGGGTPSVLPTDVLVRLLHKFEPYAREQAEITLEVNPGTVSGESLAAFRLAGFNRLSIGVQSLRELELRLLGRIHSAQVAKEAVRLAKNAGFDNISLDFLFGLPGQTQADLVLTLLETLSLAPQHLSLYALTLEKRTPLARRIAKGELSLPSEDQVADTYQAAVELLEDEGFEHYEISNFARPGFRSRHNQVYWHYGEYLGLGLGSVSFLESFRRRNTASLEDYCQRLERGELPVAQQTGKRGMAALREETILHLRTSDGFRETELANRYPKVFPRFLQQLEALKSDGLLWEDDGRWRLPPHLFLVSNQIFVRLL